MKWLIYTGVEAMLFHEIYGSYYRAAASIVKEAVRGDLTDRKLNDLVLAHAFGESLLTIPDGLRGEKWRLIRKDLTTPLRNEPSMPLTTLEKRWMKTVLQDPRIRLFDPDMTGLEDTAPLFEPDMIDYYDRNTDGDDYRDPDYIRHFQTILRALRENRNLYIAFTSGKQSPLALVLTPYYLEYSEKDDRFRLIAADRKRRWTINLSRISECRLSDKTEPAQLAEAEESSVTFELEDRRNALSRVLLHFSHLEKETKRLNENKYRVTLRYDKCDETEMVIRILSFGPVIRVTGPDSFICLLRDRIQRQKQFATFLPGNRQKKMI